MYGVLPIFQSWCWFFPNFISIGHLIRLRVGGWVFSACTYIILRCRGIMQSYIEMLVEVIQPVISVSLKHLVNFHFCRTIINPFNSTVYSKNFSVPLPSKALFCSIETALLEVVKNPICCSQISLYPIRNCDPVHVCLFSESWGCMAGPRSAEHWGAGIRRGTSALKLLSHWGADSNCIRVMFCNTNPHALFSTLLHVTFPQWSAHQLWEKQDRKGQKQWMSFSFLFFQPSTQALETPEAGLREAGCKFCANKSFWKSALSHLWQEHGF